MQSQPPPWHRSARSYLHQSGTQASARNLLPPAYRGYAYSHPTARGRQLCLQLFSPYCSYPSRLGDGSMQGSLGGASFVHINTLAMTTGGLLTSNDEWDFSPHAHTDATSPKSGLPSALTSTAFFTPEGNSPVAVYQRYRKDEDGWIWGNAAMLNDVTNNTLKDVLQEQKASTHHMHMHIWILPCLLEHNPRNLKGTLGPETSLQRQCLPQFQKTWQQHNYQHLQQPSATRALTPHASSSMSARLNANGRDRASASSNSSSSDRPTARRNASPNSAGHCTTFSRTSRKSGEQRPHVQQKSPGIIHRWNQHQHIHGSM